MNLLITGVHGFVGSNLVEAVKDQYSIYGLDIVAPAKDGVIKTFTWDELEIIPFIDAIIHLAGKAHDTKNTSKAQEYFDVNVGLTKQIFDYFLKSDARKFIFFSSVKAVADTVKNEVLSELDIPDPQTAYGQSKLEAEKYILSQPLPEEKKIYILRPAMIHGPRNKGNLNLLYNMINKGIPYPLGSFSNQRSFTSVGNLIYILGQLIEKNIQSGVYQIADSETLSTNEIIRLIGLTTGRKPKIWNLPASSVRLAAKLGDFFSLPFNSEKVKKLTENYVVSNKKITETLGISLPISAAVGLEETLVSFQEKHNNNR